MGHFRFSLVHSANCRTRDAPQRQRSSCRRARRAPSTEIPRHGGVRAAASLRRAAAERRLRSALPNRPEIHAATRLWPPPLLTAGRSAARCAPPHVRGRPRIPAPWQPRGDGSGAPHDRSIHGPLARGGLGRQPISHASSRTRCRPRTGAAAVAPPPRPRAVPVMAASPRVPPVVGTRRHDGGGGAAP